MSKDAQFSDLVGLTLISVRNIDDVEIIFETHGRKFQQYHTQDCCERVSVESIVGDLDDLVGSPILFAEETTSTTNPPDAPQMEYQDSFTWTFYRIGTVKGTVVIRWYGESNGYYSESVYFEEVTKNG